MDGSRSEIERFYDNTCVFITGGTGFLGKLLIEKLLRVTWVEKVYILVRTKKDKNEHERIKEIFEHEIFKSIKQKHPDFDKKIGLITGDCVLPNLGISDSDWDLLKANVNVVFHCAATVRFDQKIRTAAYINIRATVDIIKHAKQMKNLKAFVHVSTAYSNCPKNDIDEVFYKPTITPSKILKLLDCLTDEQLEAITHILIGEWPNTYSFTKCIAEDAVRTDAIGLPVTVLRPSIVTSTYKEPLPGWIDNFYGSSGVIFAAALGILRTLFGFPEYLAETVPADYVINIMLTSAWKVSQKKVEKDEDIDIYNFVSSPEAPISWNDCIRLSYKHGSKTPFSKIIWAPIFLMTKYRWLFIIQRFFLHTLPAYSVDRVCSLIGKKPRMVEMYKKIDKFTQVLVFFTNRQWNFGNRKTQELWNGLDEKEKELFPFSMKNVDWDKYYITYFSGARQYLLKDSLETIPSAKRKYFILHVLHYLLIFVIMCCLLLFFYILKNFLLK